jgi:hypothetical protein
MTRDAVMFKETRTFDQNAKKHLCFQTVICSECQAFENHPVKGARPLPPEPLIKYFQRQGWVMGSSRKHDICPACVKEAAAAKRRDLAKKNGERLTGSGELPPLPHKTAEIIQMNPKEPAMATPQPAPPPRTPSREDKRLIILEIEDHYLGPDRGYSVGITDASLATKLSVPVKWVIDLREEFFGPVVDPEVAILKTNLASMMERLDAHEREGREIRSKLMELKARVAKIGGGQ